MGLNLEDNKDKWGFLAKQQFGGMGQWMEITKRRHQG